MVLFINKKHRVTNELGIEIVAPDDGFMVLKILSGDNIGGEIFFDRKTLRFLSKSTKSVILLTSIKCVEFEKNSLEPHFLLKLHHVITNESAQDKNSVSTLGYIAETDHKEIINYFNKIKIEVIHSELRKD